MYKEELVDKAYNALIELNIDSDKIAKVKIFPFMLKEYVDGNCTLEEFKSRCRKLSILNDLKL